jgi:tetratricopeptide (TPR) repeat protein
MTNTTSRINRVALNAFGGAVIVLATLWIYGPALHGGWVWDDLAEIAHNAVLRDPAGIRGIWLAPAGADYFPIKTTVQWLEWHLWGDNLPAYHLVNVALHALSALLIWRILGKLGMRLGWIGGLLFAVHPLAVESVAWISEFKNTLSLPLLLLAMLMYLKWDKGGTRPPGASLHRPENRLPNAPLRRATEVASHLISPYVASILLFTAAMLSKPSVVMFPVVTLLYAWWRRGAVRWRDVTASLPFFAVSAALGLVTVWFQAHRALGGGGLPDAPLLARCAGAGLAAAFYLWKCVVPVGLAPNYPLWHLNPPTLPEFLPWLAALGLMAASLASKATARTRALRFGLGFFLLNLLPVLGFIPMSYLRISWVADHFAYLPLIGIVGLATAGFEYLVAGRGTGAKAAAVLGVAAIAGALAWQSHRYARVFSSDEALWTRTLESNPDSWTGHNNLGMDLAADGRLGEAVRHYEAAIRLKPDYVSARVNLGNALVTQGRLSDAVASYRAALAMEPLNGEALADAGNALAQSGRLQEAAECYGTLVRARPDQPEAHYGLAYVLERAGRASEAVEEYGRAIRLRPGYAEARYRLGNVLGNSGRVPEAISQYEEAIRSRPGFAEARANLGLALINSGRIPEAIDQLGKALELRPSYGEAHAYLGLALVSAGRLPEAIAQYAKALETSPSDPDIHYNLAVALRQAGRPGEAAAEFAAAERLAAGR